MMIKKVLFVCTSNVSRSQVAAFYFNRMFHDYKAISAGLSDFRAGRRVGSVLKETNRGDVLAELARRRLHILNNRARLVTEKDVKSSFAIFVFDGHQLTVLQKRFPKYSRKIFVLGKFVHLKDPDIQDAIGMDLNTYVAVYDKIREALEIIKEKELLKSLF
jgi:protein-tyrosine-phosphatase